MTLTLAILFGLFLAYANGANDNFKGVAPLYGSGTTSYERALLWTTVTRPNDRPAAARNTVRSSGL